MPSQWGRKETVIWPPHVPIFCFAALATAFFLTLIYLWGQLNFFMTPLQKSYITEYVCSGAGAQFKAHQSYRLVYLSGPKVKTRLALPVDLTDGSTTLPSGKTVSIGLSELTQMQGYNSFFRGPKVKLADASVYRWLHDAVYDGMGLLLLFRWSLILSGICLVAMLVYAVPQDIKRFRRLKYGRILRGPVLLDPTEFNRTIHGDGIGFKTSEMQELMRIPKQKEAQHFQIIGDTGTGKTQLIKQMLRQIRGRDESAIVYDPACEYITEFFDEERGDYVLNPLDARCPYWGPAQEMESNAEADAIAASLYQPTTDTKDEFFHETPAQIFAHLLKKGPSPHQLAEWLADGNMLEKLVKGTEMSFYIDRKAGPQRAGVLASLGLVAKSFRLLPEPQESARVWNARTWTKERKGWIFITSRPPERTTLRPLHSLWIDLLVMRLLTKPQSGQRPVWFVIDELASLQRLPQLHTAITENRKSMNPLILGFQGKSQLEVTYGHLAEVMLSSPATKVFLRTGETKAAEWISDGIGKVEIERLKETKFDGTRSGKNFTLDRQIEPLVMGPEISGLADRHAFLKFGNYVARFSFPYLNLTSTTPGFTQRQFPGGNLGFDPDTLSPRIPAPTDPTGGESGCSETVPADSALSESDGGRIAHQLSPDPIQWPRQPQGGRRPRDGKKKPSTVNVDGANEAIDMAHQAEISDNELAALNAKTHDHHHATDTEEDMGQQLTFS